MVFGGWKVREGWRGGGVGGELAVTEKPGTACTCPRVQISGKAVQLDAKRKIPLNGWGFGYCCIQEPLSEFVSLAWACFSPIPSPLTPPISPVWVLIHSVIMLNELLLYA